MHQPTSRPTKRAPRLSETNSVLLTQPVNGQSKRRLSTALGLSLALLAPLLAACGGGTSSSSGSAAPPKASSCSGKTVTLRMWTHDAEYAKFFSKELKPWKARYYPHCNIKFKSDVFSSGDFWNKELAAMTAGQTLPNFLDLEISHMYLFMKPGLLDAKMVNLKPLMGKSLSEFVKLDPYTYHGGLYGLESALSPVGYYYQPAIFHKYGIHTPITTWQQFYKDGLVLAHHGIAMAPAGLGGSAGLFQCLLYEDGGQFFNKAGKVAVNSPQARQVLSFIKRGLKSQVFHLVGQTGFYAPSMYRLYETGKVAGVVGADWYAGAELQTDAPHMAGKWRLQAMPRWPNSKLTTAVLGGTGIGVAKNTPNSGLAASLLKYAYGTVQGQVARWKTIGYFPNMKPAMSNPAVLHTRFPYFGGQELGRIWDASASQVPPFYVGPSFGALSTAEANELSAVYLNKATPAQAVAKMASQTKSNG